MTREVTWRWVFAACIAAIIMLALLQPPPRFPGNPSDKVQHMLAFGVLTLIAPLALRFMSPLAIGLGLSAFGGLVELLQMLPVVHRDSDFADWLVDVGAVAAVLVLRWITKRSITIPAPNNTRDGG